MRAETLGEWVDTSRSGLESLLRHRLLEPPYGYLIGVVLWPSYISLLSVWALLLSGLPSTVGTLGGLILGIGGFVVASLGSALVMGITAWNTPDERVRRQFALLVPWLLITVPLFGLYFRRPMIPYGDELGLSVFVAHELLKIVFLGPAIGFAFVASPLVVLGYRSRLE
ncbi:hypothetical protein [Halorussus salinus]|uniref:hypothetical protein n=1 Tax=Halorussus salinus TaxID=1364935 RepID=UPI001091BEFC|nr:hypothetical protein [Halorussus salinus]